MKKLFITCIFLSLFSIVNAVPIETAGNYKGHFTNNQGGVTIKCGWLWWHMCFGIDNGNIWVDDWDHTIGTVCKPNSVPEGDPVTPTNEEVYENITSGSFMNEDGSMETWYQLNSPLIFTSN